jgi:hypothetical protein
VFFGTVHVVCMYWVVLRVSLPSVVSPPLRTNARGRMRACGPFT